MKFIKIITGKCCERYFMKQHSEIGIDADKITEISHYTYHPERLSDLDPRKYMSEIKIMCDGVEKSLEIPAPLDIVLQYLNGEVSLDVIRDYEIPAPEAPENLSEWTKILESKYDINAIRKMINLGITTKTQLLQMTEADIKALPGCGGSSKTYRNVRKALIVFNLI